MTLPARRIHSEFELQEIADEQGRPLDLLVRDFALVTVAAHLVDRYGDQLCFKGGFVLRHVHGMSRFSGDLDATRTKSPKNKLPADEVAQTIERASSNLVQLRPATPTTDTGRSLDFAQIGFATPLGKGQIAVEISYREDVVDPPQIAPIGPPYFEPF